MVDELEKNLSDAIASDMKVKPISTRLALERRNGNGTTEATVTARSAADQLSLAVAGLLKMEEDLAKLTEELVGPYKEEVRDHPSVPEVVGLPMFDRVRGDARELAELALRIDKRIKFIREKL